MQLSLSPLGDVGEGPVNEEGRRSSFKGRLDPASSVFCMKSVVASSPPFLRRQQKTPPSRPREQLFRPSSPPTIIGLDTLDRYENLARACLKPAAARRSWKV
ncbi:MAG: hypothetical protein M1815_004276 [Lichina confinis]|nr:MAG: hypothetical protein M1815_004276 [Lichina confinis]